MKKLILMIAIAVGTTAFAQERKMDKKPMTSEMKVEKMTRELNLTTEQQAKAKALFDAKAEARKVNKEVSKEAFAEKKASRENFDKEFRSILTDEQVQKYDAKKEQMKQKRGEKFGKKGKMMKKGKWKGKDLEKTNS
ncbi:MAG TPA: hypothetical protein VKY82_08265 [Flavobacterium sp.]|nr:hypothetical protein [Flavobacterium sp.]